MPRPSAASCTSAQRSAAASDLRKPPWNSTATIALSTAPRSAAAASRFHAAPGAPGQAGRCHDRCHVVSGERIGLAPAPARRLAGEALQNAADAIMAGRIVGARVDVAGADRGADGAHGGRGGALVDPLGKVGGDGQRIGGQGGVSVQRRPFRPPAPCAAVLRPRVRGAAITECRIDQALADSRSANTRAQYRSAWAAWQRWGAEHGHQVLPADPAAVAAYLAERTEQGAAAATVRTIRAAIGAAYRDAGADDPTAHDGVRRVLQGLTRQAAGRGQAQALTADDCAAIMATADRPRRTAPGPVRSAQ